MAQEQSVRVFFDLDGTLLDVSERNYQVYSAVTREFGGTPLNKRAYWDLKRKKTKWPEFLPLSKLSADIEAEFLQTFIPKIESEEYLRLDILDPAAQHVLKEISSKYECRLVCLRRNEANLKKELNSLELSGYFTEVLSGHSDNDGYDRKIELIKPLLNAHTKAIIIGDTEADIVTGQRLGMTTIAITSGIRDAKFLESLHPDYIIDHLDDVLILPPFTEHSPVEGLYL
jgi:phosphoglycolate phosphatase-like HAD superfamily hydrolase